jgi:hypothetical protein
LIYSDECYKTFLVIYAFLYKARVLCQIRLEKLITNIRTKKFYNIVPSTDSARRSVVLLQVTYFNRNWSLDFDFGGKILLVTLSTNQGPYSQNFLRASHNQLLRVLFGQGCSKRSQPFAAPTLKFVMVILEVFVITNSQGQ